MSQTFLRFGKTPFGSNKNEGELLTDDIEEEDEYDALNDETFGEGAVDGDWNEDDHEKLAGFIRGGRTRLRSESEVQSRYFQDTSEEDLEDKLVRSKEILEQSISQLGLEDDLYDPAVMSRGRSRQTVSQRPLESLFGSSAPPPAILDAEECGSPKTQTIWSTNLSLSSMPAKDNSLSSLLHNLQVQPNAAPYQNNMHEIPSFIGGSLSPKTPNLLSSRACKLEDIERDLLGKSNKLFTDHNWSSSPKTMTAQQVEKELLGRQQPSRSIFNNQSFTENLGKNPWTSPNSGQSFQQDRWMSPTPPLPISGGIRTLDDVENDILLRPRAHTLDEVERSFQRNVGPPPGFSMPASRSIQPPIGTPPQGGAMFPVMGVNHVRSSPVPIGRRTPPILTPSPIGTQVSTSLPPHPILNPVRTSGPVGLTGCNVFGNYSQNSFPFNAPKGRGISMNPQLLNIQGTSDLRRFIYPRQIHHPLLNIHSFAPGWPYNQRREQSGRYNYADEYEGIMTQKEKEWLIKIQMLQLHTDNPYVDDYYHTTYIMRKMTKEKAELQDEDDDSEVKLVVPERSKQESRTYVPLQFEGSLGKLQAVSVNYPRRILEVHHMSTEEESRMPANKELHKQRRLLLDIEKFYTLFLNIDDEEKRILALPEDAQASHKENRSCLIEKLFASLCCDNAEEKFTQIASVRKGRHLIMRSIPLFSREQQIAVLSAVFSNIGYIMRRDTVDQVMPQYLNMVKKILAHCTFEEVVTLGKGLQGEPLGSGRSSPSREWRNYLAALQTKFGLSSVCNLINKAEQLVKEENPLRNDLVSHWTVFIAHIVDALCSIKESALKPPDSPPINVLLHIQRYPIEDDKLETLKAKFQLFG